MAIIKCKMCGGDLILEEGSNVAECEYCGSRQTVPSADNEKKLNLFARANRLRANNEFDKASGVYESIVADFPEEAEAYWGLILCKYGIEYVDDPGTGKKIPTCHRSSFDSVMDDPNFELVMEYADPIARRVYREEAKQIEELRKRIIEVSSREEPYDIFICYKETDENGQRTLDSVLAQDVYDMLTENGYRVFFSRVTLEDKLGVEYEPYIFAALNSAKIMLAFGTDYDYYNAVWVKNEWSRFLQLIAKGEKKTLIPCYKNIDAYDMPKEFAKLQAQDLGKVGANQDLLRGIKKILPKGEEKKEAQPVVQQVVQQTIQGGGPNVRALLDRGNMALEDGEWDKASEFYDQVLNQDARNGSAFLGLCLAKAKCANLDAFAAKLANQYANEPTQTLPACQRETKRIEEISKKLTVPGYLSEEVIVRLFDYSLTYNSREAAAKANKDKTLSALHADRNYTRAVQYADPALKTRLAEAEKQIVAACDRRIERAKSDAAAAKADVVKRYEAFLSEQEQDAEELSRNAADRRERDYREAERRAKKKKRIALIAVLAAALVIAALIVVTTVIIPNSKYNEAVKLYEAGKYEEAIAAFEALNGYKDSAEKLSEIRHSSEWMKQSGVGESVLFGNYEQDNNTSNGKEDIEWIVLAKESSRILVISKYALDCKRYNTTSTDVTWETCSLRKWLNNEFLNTAFNADERKLIPTVTVSADKNPNYSTNPGQSTQDKVFLLSIPEANKYFKSDQARKCAPTEYAVTQGATTNDSYKVDGKAACWWWLRSPGDYSDCAARVRDDGSFFHLGYYVSGDRLAVRPALWINLER